MLLGSIRTGVIGVTGWWRVRARFRMGRRARHDEVWDTGYVG